MDRICLWRIQPSPRPKNDKEADNNKITRQNITLGSRNELQDNYVLHRSYKQQP